MNNDATVRNRNSYNRVAGDPAYASTGSTGERPFTASPIFWVLLGAVVLAIAVMLARGARENNVANTSNIGSGSTEYSSSTTPATTPSGSATFDSTTQPSATASGAAAQSVGQPGVTGSNNAAGVAGNATGSTRSTPAVPSNGTTNRAGDSSSNNPVTQPANPQRSTTEPRPGSGTN
jgi:hypothetical protein